MYPEEFWLFGPLLYISTIKIFYTDLQMKYREKFSEHTCAMYCRRFNLFIQIEALEEFHSQSNFSFVLNFAFNVGTNVHDTLVIYGLLTPVGLFAFKNQN
jgi:hypothetical protein